VRFEGRAPSTVRFTIPAPVAADQPELERGGYSPATTPAQPDSHATLRAALYAGIIGAVLCTIPLVANFLLALPFAGFISVLFYRRWSHGPEPASGMAFKLGALTGLFGFVGYLVIMALSTLTSRGQNAMREAMLEVLRLQRQRATDPQTRQVLDYFATAQGMIVMLVLGFAFMAIAFVVLSGAGGTISAFLLRRKGPPKR
jgi:hypothetical protein